MTQPLCPRLWQATALQDGRLGGDDRASFERHCATCAVCRRERAALTALVDELAAVDGRRMTPLEHHRLRAIVLSRANERALLPGHRFARFGLAALAMVLAGTVGAVVLHTRGGSGPAAVPVAEPMPPQLTVRAEADAKWTRTLAATTASVDLTDGKVTFELAPLEREQRFLVRVPDGEIDVHATRVVVHVSRGQTLEVTVAEGNVTFRRPAEPELHLVSGDTWLRRQPIDAPPLAAASAQEPPAKSVAGANINSTPSARAGSIFGAAMKSFEDGDYRRADEELRAFAVTYPDDYRAEDAAYLRAVATWRAGDRDRAATLARAYLEHYPQGFRRPEARELVERAAADASAR